MSRPCVFALVSLLVVVTAGSWCRGEESRSLLATIAPWRYPGSKMDGASISDAATVNDRGERTVPSVRFQTVMTTEDPVDKVIQYYTARLKSMSSATPAAAQD